MPKVFLIPNLACLALLLGLSSCDSGTTPPMKNLFEVGPEIPTGTISEPSGLVYHPNRGTLFVVGDKGEIGEISSDDVLLNKETHEERTFEGLTLDIANDRLYAITEGDDNIVVINPVDLKIQAVIQIDRKFNGETVIDNGGNGIEGLTFAGEVNGSPTFFAVNQALTDDQPDDSSALLKLEIPIGTLEAKIVAHYPMTILDLSGIYLDSSGILYVTSDNENKLIEMSQLGDVVREHEGLPGSNQEGVARDLNGLFYIAQDSGNILTFSLNP